MLTLIAAAMIAAGTPSKPVPKEPPTGPAIAATDAELSAIRAALDDDLADAESARLKDVVVRHSEEGDGHACGKLNAKNRFGAYVGYQPLYADVFKLKNGKLMAVAWGTDPDIAAMLGKQRSM